jgi:quercetin dioxygenase-like cupin family protein
MVDSAALAVPLARQASTQRSAWYLGHLFSFLAEAGETHGQFSVMEILAYKGGEPPLHVHRADDEAFYVLEGSLTYFAGNHVLPAPAGTFVFLPKNVPHSFALQTDTVKLLCLLVPGGGEAEFREMGEPAQALTLGPMPESEPDPATVAEMMAKYHYEIVGPPPALAQAQP